MSRVVILTTGLSLPDWGWCLRNQLNLKFTKLTNYRINSAEQFEGRYFSGWSRSPPRCSVNTSLVPVGSLTFPDTRETGAQRFRSNLLTSKCDLNNSGKNVWFHGSAWAPSADHAVALLLHHGTFNKTFHAHVQPIVGTQQHCKRFATTIDEPSSPEAWEGEQRQPTERLLTNELLDEWEKKVERNKSILAIVFFLLFFFVHLLPEFFMPTFVSLNLFAVTGVPKVLQSISGAADVWRSAALTMRAMESPAWPALIRGKQTFDPLDQCSSLSFCNMINWPASLF